MVDTVPVHTRPLPVRTRTYPYTWVHRAVPHHGQHDGYTEAAAGGEGTRHRAQRPLEAAAREAQRLVSSTLRGENE